MFNFAPLSMLCAALVFASPIAALADSQHVQGDQFITAMKDNTLSGTNAHGYAFNIYFLPGGEVTYADKAGVVDRGTWHLDRDGDVCVLWQNPVDAQEGCFRVSTKGDKVIWRGKQGSRRDLLRGGVTETFLSDRR